MLSKITESNFVSQEAFKGISLIFLFLKSFPLLQEFNLFNFKKLWKTASVHVSAEKSRSDGLHARLVAIESGEREQGAGAHIEMEVHMPQGNDHELASLERRGEQSIVGIDKARVQRVPFTTSTSSAARGYVCGILTPPLAKSSLAAAIPSVLSPRKADTNVGVTATPL